MTFDEIIEALYSEDKSLICDVLNTGSHISDFRHDPDIGAIHTGFYCRVQTGTIFDAIYLIPKQMICYRNITISSFSKYYPLGFPLLYSPIEFNDLCYCKSVKDKWIQAYNMATGEFDIVSRKGIEMKDQSAESIILDNDLKVSSFSIMDGSIKKKDYPLYPAYIPELYKGKEFSPQINFSRTYDYSDNEPTYEKYGGTYAQDLEGCDDDFIDDVLGGEPEAYWNID